MGYGFPAQHPMTKFLVVMQYEKLTILPEIRWTSTRCLLRCGFSIFIRLAATGTPWMVILPRQSGAWTLLKENVSPGEILYLKLEPLM